MYGLPFFFPKVRRSISSNRTSVTCKAMGVREYITRREAVKISRALAGALETPTSKRTFLAKRISSPLRRLEITSLSVERIRSDYMACLARTDRQDVESPCHSFHRTLRRSVSAICEDGCSWSQHVMLTGAVRTRLCGKVIRRTTVSLVKTIECCMRCLNSAQLMLEEGQCA